MSQQLLPMMQAAAGSQVEKIYVEDVFSTTLYIGNAGVSRNITNDINLSGKGGMVWLKGRGVTSSGLLYDTVRGAGKGVPLPDVMTPPRGEIPGLAGPLTAFLGNGFTLGTDTGGWSLNDINQTYVSWSFREARKFFDVITYTGTGVNRTISHNLGSVPGMILVKRTDTTGDWQVYHRSLVNTEYMVLNSTAAKVTDTTRWNSTTPTATVFSVGTDVTVNANGGTYVAYLFAHDAGGFGNDGSQNVISCGSFTTNSSGSATVNLGYEPQFILWKEDFSGTGRDWTILDNMRGLASNTYSVLNANLNFPEASNVNYGSITSTGFSASNLRGNTTFYYLAIRRGPMKTPTDATKVFAPVIYTGDNSTYRSILTGFPTDLYIYQIRSRSAEGEGVWFDRMRGGNQYLITRGNRGTDAEGTFSIYSQQDVMDGWKTGNNGNAGAINVSPATVATWNFRRAPGFFDVVNYISPGTAGYVVNHNLGVVPELVIIKSRSVASGYKGWAVYHKDLGVNKAIALNLNEAATDVSVYALSSTPTTTQVPIGNSSDVAFTNGTFVAYLFASCPGVSKIGSYTGNGSSQNINCGFTNGARFVLIKRTDNTGDWYVWDTARGIVSANDPHLSINTTVAEVATDDSIDPLAAGFTVNQLAATNINVNAATYIYLAIA